MPVVAGQRGRAFFRLSSFLIGQSVTRMQRRISEMKRTAFNVLVILAMLVSAFAATTAAAAAAPAGKDDGLGKHDRDLLAQARAKGESTVILLIAALPG